jgi:DNA polymerase-3 subunit gamma/tau
MASTGKEITLSLTQTVLGTATSQTVIALVGAVLDREPVAGMDAIHTALDSGTDPRLLARQVVDYLRALLLIQMGNTSQVDLAADTRAQAEKHARAFSQVDVLRMIRSFNAAATDLRGGWQPSLPLELALAEMMETPATIPSTLAASAKKVLAETKAPAVGKVGTTADGPPIQKEAEKPAARSISESKSTVTIDQIAKVWKQICVAIKLQSSSLNGLLNSCKLLEIKEGMLVLGFQSELLRSKADTPDQMEIVHKAIYEVLSVDVTVRCVVSNAKQSAPPDVKSDGMVAAALKAGGEIVDVQK